MTREKLKVFILQKIEESGRVDGLSYAIKYGKNFTEELDSLLKHTAYLGEEVKPFTERFFHIVHELTERPLCKANCGNDRRFKKYTEGYYSSCGDKKCKDYLARLANIGKKRTEETKKKISESNKGKISPLRGRGRTEETKKKIGDGNRGKTVSEDTKRKLSESRKGKIYPKAIEAAGRKETKEKRKQTLKDRYGVTNSFFIGGNRHFSKISQELFWHLHKIIKYDRIFFAELNQEYFLNGKGSGYYQYDFTVLNNKKIIEFNGDYWHGNPSKYDKKDKISFPDNKNVLVEDIWNRDGIKNKFAESRGFDVLVVWENDYRKNTNKIIESCLEFIKG